MFCSPDSRYLCSNGCGNMLSKTRLGGMCARCEGRIKKQERHEYKWLSKLKDWGYHPSVHDKVIKGEQCVVANTRRVDFLFATEKTFPYHVLVECDERSHTGVDVSCEMKRLQEVHDQLIANSCSTKPLVVIRFNPDSKDDIEDEIKLTLDYVFKGSVSLGDARGITVHKLIGYGKARRQQYEDEPVTKKIKF